MYDILDLSKKLKWSEYLNELPVSQQDVYFTPEYYEINENYTDGKALCFVFRDKDKIAIYPFLKNLINRNEYWFEEKYYDIQGAYGYNGVVSNCYDTDFNNKFHSVFNDFCIENNIVAEFTRFHPLLNNHSFSLRNMTIVKDRKTVFLDLAATESEIWNSSYSSTNRNMIRKAIKSNVEVSFCTQSEDYLSFYRMYQQSMQDLRALPTLYFNERYFKDFQNLIPSFHELLLAKVNGEVISGMILMTFKNHAHYHLSCRKRDYATYASNNLLLDFSIKHAKSKGCKFFHFGGGNSSSENDALFRFKANFSKSYADFYIGKKIHNKRIYDLTIEKWKKYFPDSFVKNKFKLLGYRDIN